VSLLPDWLNPLNWIGSVVNAIAQGIGSFIKWLVDSLSWIAGQVWSLLSTIANNFVNSIVSFMTNTVLSPVTGFINTLLQRLQTKLFGVAYLAIATPLLVREAQKLAESPSLKGFGMFILKPLIVMAALQIMMSALQPYIPVAPLPQVTPPSLPPVKPLPPPPLAPPPSSPPSAGWVQPPAGDTVNVADYVSVSTHPPSTVPLTDMTGAGDLLSVSITQRSTQSASGYDELSVSDSPSVTKQTAEPSGADPYNPKWCPSDGWSQLVVFNSPDDIANFFTSQRYATVQNGVLTFNPPSGSYGAAQRYVSATGLAKRVAIAIKISAPQTIFSDIVVRNVTSFGGSGIGFEIRTVANDPNSLTIRDWASGASITHSPFTGFYFVIVAFYDQNIVAWYQPDGTFLGQLQLSSGSATDNAFNLEIYAPNNYNGETWNVYIDWIAVKY